MHRRNMTVVFGNPCLSVCLQLAQCNGGALSFSLLVDYSVCVVSMYTCYIFRSYCSRKAQCEMGRCGRFERSKGSSERSRHLTSQIPTSVHRKQKAMERYSFVWGKLNTQYFTLSFNGSVSFVTSDLYLFRTGNQNISK